MGPLGQGVWDAENVHVTQTVLAAEGGGKLNEVFGHKMNTKLSTNAAC
jgi:hypothetical protein